MSKFLSMILLTISATTLTFYFKGVINEQPTDNKKTVVIKHEDNSTEKAKLEEYLIGVVACEMPALYGEEALKAQAIASRTYAVYKSNRNLSLASTTDDQCYMTQEELKKRWGEDYDKYYGYIKNAVKSTENIILTKDNKEFITFYFSTSNGHTEDSMAVFNQTGITGVSSLWDKESNNYKREITMTKKDLVSILGNFNNIEIISRNNTNHVTKVNVDDKEYSGVKFRSLLGLRSTDFEITTENDNYIFTTYGYGHGVGMSQYGASYLAKNGKNYEEILKYYYGDIEFAKL